MSLSRQGMDGRRLRWAGVVVLWTLLGLLVAVAGWELAGGGGVIRLGGLRISAHNPARPLALALVVLALLSFADPRLQARLFDNGRRRVPWRAVPWPRRLGMLAIAIGLAANLAPWFEIYNARRSLYAKSRLIADSGLCANGAQEHLPALVGAIATGEYTRGAAIHIHAADARGHLSAYYAYPRLLYMGPELRRWSVLERMLRTGEPDPGFADPGGEPELDASRRFAASRGLPLLEVWPDRTELHVAGVVPPAP